MNKRIQRTRVKGYRMPPNAVSIARPGRYGNPYKIGDKNYGISDPKLFIVTKENCLELFERYARRMLEVNPNWLEPLRGKDLACFCRDGAACHGDVLLRLLGESDAKR